MLYRVLVEQAGHERMSDEYKNQYIVVVLLKPTSWVLPDNSRSPPQGFLYRTSERVQVNLINTNLPKT